MPNLRAYRVVNELDPVSRIPPSTNGYFQHVGHMVWLRRNVVEPPRTFGSQPMQIKMAPMELAPGQTSGLTAHMMHNYLPRMCDTGVGYDWSRYERSLQTQMKSLM